MKNYNDYINTIEKLFEENRPKDAEQYILKAIDEARKEGDKVFELQMLNELIGYYRQTSEREKLLDILKLSISLADDMKLLDSDNGKVSYATTALNVATGYRSIGELEQSEHYYRIVSRIYDETLDGGDMLRAGLYNNMSLLYQEKQDFLTALFYQKKALKIVLQNEAGFEIAVTYANLANTAVQVALMKEESERSFDEAREYALEGMRRFEERGTIDAHYSAAISALATCYYLEGKFDEAGKWFQKAMDIVEKCLGRNAQYYRLMENRNMCENNTTKNNATKNNMNGMKLSKMYYEEFGRPMLEKDFSEYIDKMAIGLVGKGSDCLGYDDMSSMDHDWGPDFCIWLPDEVYDEIGEKLTKAYETLPLEYKGYKKTMTAHYKGRRGVFKMSDFFKKLVGSATYEDINWREVPEYALLNASNGEIYQDDEGTFTELHSRIGQGFPEEILYLKLADDVAHVSQTGQYNYLRMLKRGDRLTADLILADCIRYIMILAHHMENKFVPHDKWIARSFRSLGNSTLDQCVRRLHSSFKMNDEEALAYVDAVMEEVGSYVAGELYARDLISDVESYIDVHSEELAQKSIYSKLTNEELVHQIARVEFTAFDEVRNEGGRASCQDDWITFRIMRESQYMTWDRTMLLQYIYDFNREYRLGHNLITEKYGRMMESTAPDKYAKIADKFPHIPEDKKAIIEQIVGLQMAMLESFGQEYPELADNTRSFHTYEDNPMNTSYETYLRGEISTYSDKMLQLYGRYVVGHLQAGKNIARETIENTAKLYGFESLDAFAAKSHK